MTLRRSIQLLMLALFVTLSVLALYQPPESDASAIFLRLDPLVSIQAALAGRVWLPALVIGFAMLGLTLVLGRFFCGWMCPLGTCLELGDDLLGRRRKRRLKNDARLWRGVKYAFLLLILVAALFGQGLVYWLDPLCWMTRLVAWALWPLVLIGGNGLLDLARPLLEWAGFMGLARTTLNPAFLNGGGFVALLFLFALLWLGRYQRRFYCRSLCPLGALFGLFARFSVMRRRVGIACDGDGKCGRTCETGAIDATDRRRYDPGECIQCGRCVPDCHLHVTDFVPLSALSTVSETDSAPAATPSRKAGLDLSRRQALGAVGAGTLGALWLGHHPTSLLADEHTIRPPGALPEPDFLARCVRCGACMQACPTHCLQPAWFEAGPAGVMTPMAVLRLGPCEPTCNACGIVCPTNAIRELSFQEKPYAKLGNAVIDPGRCVVWEQGRYCLVCDENCPYAAITWKEIPGGDRRPFVDEARCNGCGSCEHACPVAGPAAIRVGISGQLRLSDGSYFDTARDHGLTLESGDGFRYY